MPFAAIDIANMALGIIGVSDEIQDLDKESSKEAAACRRYYELSRAQVLRDFPWPRQRSSTLLVLVASQPNTQWASSYRLPGNIARILRLKVDNSPRLDTTSTRIPYALGRDATGGLLYTDVTSDLNPTLEFVYDETDPSQLTADVAAAISLLLATSIAACFGPEAVKLGDRALKLYQWRLNEARATALTEDAPDLPGETDMIRARDGSGSGPPSDGFLPTGPGLAI